MKVYRTDEEGEIEIMIDTKGKIKMNKSINKKATKNSCKTQRKGV